MQKRTGVLLDELGSRLKPSRREKVMLFRRSEAPQPPQPPVQHGNLCHRPLPLKWRGLFVQGRMPTAERLTWQLSNVPRQLITQPVASYPTCTGGRVNTPRVGVQTTRHGADVPTLPRRTEALRLTLPLHACLSIGWCVRLVSRARSREEESATSSSMTLAGISGIKSVAH